MRSLSVTARPQVGRAGHAIAQRRTERASNLFDRLKALEELGELLGALSPRVLDEVAYGDDIGLHGLRVGIDGVGLILT